MLSFACLIVDLDLDLVGDGILSLSLIRGLNHDLIVNLSQNLSLRLIVIVIVIESLSLSLSLNRIEFVVGFVVQLLGFVVSSTRRFHG